MKDVQALFDSHSGQFQQFDKVGKKLSQRPHLHAVMLLNSLLPSTGPIFRLGARAGVFLNFSLDALGGSAVTEDQICDLVRCGVRYEEGWLTLTV